jgi:hypothetical protein
MTVVKWSSEVESEPCGRKETKSISTDAGWQPEAVSERPGSCTTRARFCIGRLKQDKGYGDRKRSTRIAYLLLGMKLV